MDEEHHYTGMVADVGIGFGIKIIQKVVYTGGSIGGGDGLFSSNVTKTDKDGVVDGYGIIEEDADDLLDVFEKFLRKDGTFIGRGCILDFGPKCRLCMEVGGVLLAAFEVAEPEEGNHNISGNLQISRSLSVIPF